MRGAFSMKGTERTQFALDGERALSSDYIPFAHKLLENMGDLELKHRGVNSLLREVSHLELDVNGHLTRHSICSSRMCSISPSRSSSGSSLAQPATLTERLKTWCGVLRNRRSNSVASYESTPTEPPSRRPSTTREDSGGSFDTCNRRRANSCAIAPTVRADTCMQRTEGFSHLSCYFGDMDQHLFDLDFDLRKLEQQRKQQQQQQQQQQHELQPQQQQQQQQEEPEVVDVSAAAAQSCVYQ
jgi:hypothetical protein